MSPFFLVEFCNCFVGRCLGWAQADSQLLFIVQDGSSHVSAQTNGTQATEMAATWAKTGIEAAKRMKAVIRIKVVFIKCSLHLVNKQAACQT
jgi:hypothetical protein